ncbi:MAG: VOC family protein [Gammaproteobacteria bacterium]
MQKITPCLWFDGDAEEAVNLYVEALPDTRITDTTRYSADSAAVSGQPEGSVMSLHFEVGGQTIMALNGGAKFSFTPATSLMVDCRDQCEVDRAWDKLLEGGRAMRCGWITDRFGVTWQIVPSELPDFIRGSDAQASKRALQAMLKMTKLDIDELRRAYEQA